ncbi:MAG: hypothetical protein H6799_03220 [Candidatus Nomurabacteria bacterium]|nr:MAG: hypothetical protein H6799_03220 [Candidatus Nomurabacteria bacterium]HRV75797.1 hypothetical protein [Candidatus Saccharimonadales bacterium]
MPEKIKNPANCASAVFIYDDKDRSFRLSECANWGDVSKLDHRALGIARSDTSVFPVDDASGRDKMIMQIGAKSSRMCAVCDRYMSKQVNTDTFGSAGKGVVRVTDGTEFQVRIDESLGNGDILDPSMPGVPNDPTAELLYLSGS